MPQRLGITLFFCFTLISLLASRANATLHAEPHHKRLFKKRMPQLLAFPDPAAGGAPTPAQVSPSTPATTTTTTTPAEGVSTAASQASSGSSSSISNTASTSPSSALSSSTSASSHISSTPTPTVVSSNPGLGNAGASTSLPGLQTQTETVGSASPSSTTQTQSDATSTSQQKLTLTVIVIIASSVGGIAILWTVFRKWKLGRSSRFNERLQPIDWKPASEDKRIRPVSTASSFHSGGHDLGSDHGHERGPGNLTPLPEHDFTALSSSRLGGYADLARGPSPQPPQMLETYGRGPVAGYDANVPLHHQAGYGGRDYTNYSNNAPMRY